MFYQIIVWFNHIGGKVNNPSSYWELLLKWAQLKPLHETQVKIKFYDVIERDDTEPERGSQI